MKRARQTVLQLINRGVIAPKDAEQAMVVAGIVPDEHAWGRFGRNVLLSLGVASTVLGVIFFVAFNWDALGRIGKFALVEIVLILSMVPLLWRDRFTRTGQMALLSVSVLTGALLALYGQVYQTGADPWQLFAMWALLILPWVGWARLEALWLVWIAITNVAIVLWAAASPLKIGVLLGPTIAPALSALLLDAVVLVVWELHLQRSGSTHRFGVRVVAILTGVAATLIAINAIMEHRISIAWLGVWIVWMGLLCTLYRQYLRDLFVLVGGCLSGLIVVTALGIRLIISGRVPDVIGFWLLAFVIIGIASWASTWLRSIARLWRES